MITTEQRIQRKKYIGSSDAAAILGIDPWRNASDVWLEKTGRVEGNSEETAAMRAGTLLEPSIIQWASQQIGHAIVTDAPMLIDGPLCANLDGQVLRDGNIEIVEAKTTGSPEGWGDEGTDQIPDNYLVQIHHQFALVPTARVCWVPVLMPGYRSFDFKMYKVERNDTLVATVRNAGLEFMEKHVGLDIPPDDFRPSIEALKRMRRAPKSCVTISDEMLLQRWRDCKAALKQVEAECERAQADVLAQIGDNEAAEFPSGKLTYLEQCRRAIDTDALRAKYPEIADELTTTLNYRVLRWKAAK